MNAKIISWLLGAIASWGSPANPPEHRAHLAESFATVAYDEGEPAYYQGPTGRALTALALVSLASLESRFEQRIIDGQCRPHECDGGKATGLLQVHLGDYGMRFLGGKERWCASPAPDCWTKAEVLGNVDMQIRTGLHVLRTQGPKAWRRHFDAQQQAAAYVERHPVPVGDGEVMGWAK